MNKNVKIPSKLINYLLGSLGILYVFTIAACNPVPAVVQFAGSTMGTTYTIKFFPPSTQISQETIQKDIDNLLATINQQMSTYDPNSELSRFNQNQTTDWVEISHGLLVVMQEAQRISQLTDGAFDVTVGPLVNVWGFGPQMTGEQLPREDDLQATKTRVGYHKIELRDYPTAMRKTQPDVYIDLSAIAKGYAVDKIAHYLDVLKIKNYLVEIGGELRGRGHNPKGERWAVAIEKPQPQQRAIQRIVRITHQGVATSGNYRNFFEHDGRRYSHIINPKTGQPVYHELASATVVSPTCMEADAWATALMVLGLQRSLSLAEEQGLAVLLIAIQDGQFVEYLSTAMQVYVK